MATSTYTWEVRENLLTFHPDLHGCLTLDDVAAKLRETYPGWFVYRGGSHVALHRSAGNETRLLLVVETEA